MALICYSLDGSTYRMDKWGYFAIEPAHEWKTSQIEHTYPLCPTLHLYTYQVLDVTLNVPNKKASRTALVYVVSSSRTCVNAK